MCFSNTRNTIVRNSTALIMLAVVAVGFRAEKVYADDSASRRIDQLERELAELKQSLAKDAAEQSQSTKPASSPSASAQGDAGHAKAGRAVEKHANTGQDPTKPLTRFDLRYQLTNPNDGSGGDLNTLILRTDAPIVLGRGKSKGKYGVVYTRMDAPIISRNADSSDPDDDGDTGFGNLYTQALHIVPKSWPHVLGIDAWAWGPAVNWGTATNRRLGRDKESWLGILGTKWNLNEGGSSFIATVFKYEYGEGDDNQDELSQLKLQPIMNFNVMKYLSFVDFVTLWGNYDMLFNLKDGNIGPKESGDVFIPYDVTFGKMLNPHVVLTLSFAGPIYESDGYEQYDFQSLIRVGFFFN